MRLLKKYVLIIKIYNTALAFKYRSNISSCFQIYGRHFLLRDNLNSLIRCLYIEEEVALNILGEITFGPGGLVTLSSFILSITSCSVIMISINLKKRGVHAHA